MNPDSELWKGLRNEAIDALEIRDYSKADLGHRLSHGGVEANELHDQNGRDFWIPGIEVIPRKVFQQRNRGYFAEMGRQEDGRLNEIGLWPKQWATATMYSPSAKGFHIHPPFIPDGTTAEDWFRKQFVEDPDNFELRPYNKEQWDVMFFLVGIAEMFLIDERKGMPRRKMRFFIEGDNRPGPNNVSVVIPPGVAHGIRSASSQDLLMVYGTSTKFEPSFEGRIVSDVEKAPLAEVWSKYFDN